MLPQGRTGVPWGARTVLGVPVEVSTGDQEACNPPGELGKPQLGAPAVRKVLESPENLPPAAVQTAAYTALEPRGTPFPSPSGLCAVSHPQV